MNAEGDISNRSRLFSFGVSLGLTALVWFVFGQTRSYPFINFDDPEYVYEVPQINQGLTVSGVIWALTGVLSPSWCPLTNISHMLDAQFFGMNAGGHHLTNVVLHALSAILLAFVLWNGTGASWRSAFVAAIFAIHPLRVESVAWVTERKDVLSGLFFMLTLGAYVWYARRRSLGRYMVMSILFACGLLSKPMLVTTPVVLLLLDYWPLRRGTNSRAWWRLIVEKFPLFALSALACVAAVLTQTVAERSLVPPSLWLRTQNAFVSIVVYIRQTFWPTDLGVFYPHPADHLNGWLVLLSAVLVVGISCFAFVVRRQHPYVIVGWCWYVVMLSPVLGIVQAGKQAHADRFTYLPQIGLYLIISWAVAEVTIRWPKRRTILAGAAILVIGTLAVMARGQTTYWRDSESLWSHTIDVTKDNAFAHASLADLLLRRGRLDEAIAHCHETLRINANDADAHNNLGLALLQKGAENDAAAEFRKSLEIDPNHMNAAPNLAWILATSSNPATRNGDRAVELAENVLHHAGHPNAIVLRTLAAAYAEIGRFSDAVTAAEQASQLAMAQGDSGLSQDLERAISYYKMGRPLRSFAPKD
jgi:protein O-mannosyl-transferase